ncbi:hypothetical protein BS50DRAFT_278207 [Corynespora cassiicola Philippines]|uniref:Uncharacterized protein n=1 Tax=Corynespora cassiicola Philippines TaxID=1448308 RepID=A0A2T2P0N1_CORCC|nr:hypothetical protein BS50DRAFT_278207 [Corynespora cassiicola Philippines]
MLGLRVGGLASGLIQCVRYTLYVPTFVFDLNSLLGWNGALRRLIIPLVNTTLVYFCDNFEPWKLHALSPFFSLYCLSYDVSTAWMIFSLLNAPTLCIVFKSFRTHLHTLKNGEHGVSSQPQSSSHEQKVKVNIARVLNKYYSTLISISISLATYPREEREEGSRKKSKGGARARGPYNGYEEARIRVSG